MNKKYRRMIRIMLSILKKMNVPLFLHPKSKHTFSTHQHIALLVLRQYESKSHESSVEWLEVAAEITIQLQLKTMPRFTTLQKAAARLQGSLLHKMLQEFILYKKVRLVLAGIDGSGFSHSTASYYCTKRVQLRRNFLKVVVCADMNSQLICSVMLRHNHSHGNPDFLPLLEKTNNVAPVGIVLGDMGFDDENRP